MTASTAGLSGCQGGIEGVAEIREIQELDVEQVEGILPYEFEANTELDRFYGTSDGENYFADVRVKSNHEDGLLFPKILAAPVKPSNQSYEVLEEFVERGQVAELAPGVQQLITVA